MEQKGAHEAQCVPSITRKRSAREQLVVGSDKSTIDFSILNVNIKSLNLYLACKITASFSHLTI